MGLTESSVGLSAIEEGMKKIPDLPPEVLTHQVIRAAFRAARGAYDGLYDDKDDPEDLKMQWAEFRIFLVFVKLYFRMFVLFDSLDESGDGNINATEFKQSIAYLEKWGAKIDDPDAEFKKIDSSGDGNLNFKEFTKWAIQASLANDENGGKDTDEAAMDILNQKEGN